MANFGDLMNSKPQPVKSDKPIESPTLTPQDIKTPSKVSNKISSEISSSVDKESLSYEDSVRRAIRWPGKENSPLRITTEELTRYKAAVRYFEDKGYFTDRTQIIRACVSYCLDDLELNGDSSALARIMERINTY